MKHQFDIIRDHLTLSECLFLGLARRHRAPAGCFFFSGAEASWRRRRREHATGFSVFSAASASVDIRLAARIGTDGHAFLIPTICPTFYDVIVPVHEWG